MMVGRSRTLVLLGYFEPELISQVGSFVFAGFLLSIACLHLCLQPNLSADVVEMGGKKGEEPWEKSTYTEGAEAGAQAGHPKQAKPEANAGHGKAVGGKGHGPKLPAMPNEAAPNEEKPQEHEGPVILR
jgi:hypothetical protein